MNKGYNYIYSKLVKSEDDIFGILAYGIYKKHKIEFVQKIKDEQKREPTNEECLSFFAASTTESQLDNYRRQAEIMLADTVSNMVKEDLTHFEYDMLHNYRKEISACIPSNWKTFCLRILAGVASTFFFTLIAAMFYFMGETSDRSTHNKTKQIMKEVVNTQGSKSNDNVYRINK